MKDVKEVVKILLKNYTRRLYRYLEREKDSEEKRGEYNGWIFRGKGLREGDKNVEIIEIYNVNVYGNKDSIYVFCYHYLNQIFERKSYSIFIFSNYPSRFSPRGHNICITR